MKIIEDMKKSLKDTEAELVETSRAVDTARVECRDNANALKNALAQRPETFGRIAMGYRQGSRREGA